MSTKSSFFKGVAFIAAAKYSNIIIGIIITAILSRILTPGDFGTVAIATVLISFFYLLTDLGIGPAIVQYRDLQKKNISHLFGWSFWLAVIWGVVFFLSAPLIANFYNLSNLTPICRLLSLQIVFSTLNIVPNALLMREKKFNIVAIRNVIINVFCGFISVVTAYRGLGIYALLINPILGGILSLVVNEYFMRLPIKLFPSTAPLKIIFSFSFYQFLFNLVNYFGRSLDKLLIGKLLPAAELGYYEKSYRLMMQPIGNINGVIDPVLHPFLSESQNDINKIYSVYCRMNRVLVSLSFPIAALFVICSREFVLLIYGMQWKPAVSYFSILAISIASQITNVSTGSILQSCNQTKLLFKIGNVNVVVTIVGLILSILIWKSVMAVSISFTVTAYFVSIFTLAMVHRKCFRQSPWPFYRYCLIPILYFIFVIFVWRIADINVITISELIVSLCVKVVIWAIITFVFLQLFTAYKPLVYLKSFIEKRKKK